MATLGAVLDVAKTQNFSRVQQMLEDASASKGVRQEVLRLVFADPHTILHVPAHRKNECVRLLEYLVRDSDANEHNSVVNDFATALIVSGRFSEEDLRLAQGILQSPSVRPNMRVVSSTILRVFTEPIWFFSPAAFPRFVVLVEKTCEHVGWSDFETWLTVRRIVRAAREKRYHECIQRIGLFLHPAQLMQLGSDIDDYLVQNAACKTTRLFRARGWGVQLSAEACRIARRNGRYDEALGPPHHRWVWLVLLRGGGKNCGGLSGGKGLTQDERELILRLLKPWFGDYLTDAKDLTV